MSEREPPRRWRKSSFSGDGDCLEWWFGSGEVAIRNSRDADGLVISLTHAEWAAFIAGVKCGEADAT
jgi:hypothetical protein